MASEKIGPFWVRTTATLRITNGRIGADKNIGRYTCYTHNGTSTVDYLLCSPSIMSYITEFTVRDQNDFSDHCPIDFSLLTHSAPQAEEVGQCSGKIVWDSNKCEDFMCNLVRTPSTSRFEEMMLVMNNVTVVSQHDIQLAVDCFTEGVRAAAGPLFYRASGKSDSDFRFKRFIQGNDTYWQVTPCLQLVQYMSIEAKRSNP